MAAAAQRDVSDHYARQAKREGYVARSAYKLLEIQQKKKIINRGDRVLDLGCAPGAWLQVACQALGPFKAGGTVIGIDLKPVRIPQRHCDRRVVVLQGDALEMSLSEIVAQAEGQQQRHQPSSAIGHEPDEDRERSQAETDEGHEHARPSSSEEETDAAGNHTAHHTVKPFDVVLSDMMSSTAGHAATDHFRSVELARRALELAMHALRPGGSFVVKVFEGEAYNDFLQECRMCFPAVKGFSPKASRNESREMFVICERFKPIEGN
ncbi:MAG: SAM-dependent methyltransferase [Planctomycetota bacterium]